MSIRTRIFRTFLSLIFIFILYLCLFFFIGYLRSTIDSDKVKIYEVKNTWNEILISMHNIVINWSDGKSYELFLEKNNIYNKELLALSDKIQSRYFYSNALKIRISSVLTIWQMAQDNIDQIIIGIESQDFKKIVYKTKFSPGLQRLNHLWTELFYDGTDLERKEAYAIKQVIDAIEFFPIYSDTVNRLYNFILDDTKSIYLIANQIQKFLSIIFVLIFLTSTLFFSYVSTKSITEPIINSICKLTKFMGKTIEKIEYTHTDELKLLSKAVSMLIDHYTKLSDTANKLADGNINSRIRIFSKQDIVGNALKKVLNYLNELAEASNWIKNGNYGAEIKVKSDKDILAKSFNVMSNEINEKIETMTNIFEKIQEGVIVFDEDLKIVEANRNFLKIICAEDISEIALLNDVSIFFQEGSDFVKRSLSGTIIDGYFTRVVSLKNIKIPVTITAYTIKNNIGKKKKVMLFITNESLKIRIKREKEKLKAQAAIASLRALRAQINPHFLFNTLNSIAQLIETNSAQAVDIIEKLADIFRYTLSVTKRNTVKFFEELNHIQTFLEIEKLRYDKRLNIHYDIDEEVSKINIPPMLLQPLIENAIRYGEDDNGNVILNIKIKKEKGNMLINISDQGNRELKINNIFTKPGPGLGIKNVNHRLKTLYNRKLFFKKNHPNGLVVSMKIPVSIQ